MTQVERLFPKNHPCILGKFYCGEVRIGPYYDSISIAEIIDTIFIRYFAYFLSLFTTSLLGFKDSYYFL